MSMKALSSVNCMQACTHSVSRSHDNDLQAVARLKFSLGHCQQKALFYINYSFKYIASYGDLNSKFVLRKVSLFACISYGSGCQM